MTKDIVMNTGTRTGTLWLTSTELFVVVSECRWMVLFILFVVLADFWYGRSEASKRYQIAKESNDTVHQNEYKWRTSRAIRRTVNKLIDYLLWLCVGAVFGMALLQPIGVDFVYAVVGATAVVMFCEVKSIISHFLYLHGYELKQRTLGAFLRTTAITLAKRKSPDLGEAIEEGLNSASKEQQT